ncbi:MAG: hypothetical protein R3321_04760 [Nitrososphaeraceae archaeon]|nr:hypothetical protein [Nitrososphaeraceae archaeon]
MTYSSNPIKIDTNASRKAMKKLASNFKRFLKSYWLRQSSPIDNRKWVARKDNEPHPILNKSGNMMRKTIFKSDNNQLIARMVEYGIFHQFGTEKMPERPWIGLTDEAVEFFVDELLENIIND